MRKQLFIVIAAVMVILSGCTKNEIITQSESSKGILMSFKVSIGSPSTKTVYTPDDKGAIKVSWKNGDKISVVSFDKDGIPVSNDLFETMDEGENATFTGTYTGDEAAPLIKVFYPAFMNSDEDIETGKIDWFTSKEAFYILNYEPYCYSRLGGLKTGGDGDPSFLEDYDAMSAAVTSIDKLSEVSLNKHTSVIKLVVNTSDVPEGWLFTEVTIMCNHGASPQGDCYSASETDFAENEFDDNVLANVYLGNLNDLQRQYENAVSDIPAAELKDCFVKSNDDNEMVIYIPYLTRGVNLDSGSDCWIQLNCVNPSDESWWYGEKTYTFKNDVEMPAGSCYTIKMNFSDLEESRN